MSAPPSTPEQRRSFIQSQTTVATPPLTPEIKLHLATEITPIWEATEATLEANNLPPPYWAFAWPGGQAASGGVMVMVTVQPGWSFCSWRSR